MRVTTVWTPDSTVSPESAADGQLHLPGYWPGPWPRATTRTCATAATRRPVIRPNSRCCGWPPTTAKTCRWPRRIMLARASMIRRGQRDTPLTAMHRAAISRAMTDYAGRGLRVLAIARRQLPAGSAVPGQRAAAEHDLCLL